MSQLKTSGNVFNKPPRQQRIATKVWRKHSIYMPKKDFILFIAIVVSLTILLFMIVLELSGKSKYDVISRDECEYGCFLDVTNQRPVRRQKAF